jgi:apolipoprotein D and lipocalin family protein
MKIILLFALILTISACKKDNSDQTVEYLDLERFMGDWYVISILPNPIETNAVNSIESYTLNDKGNIDITYSFYQKEKDGKKKVMHPKASVYNTITNSEWRVQFIWPIKFPYLVIWLDEDYQTTVIGVSNRKYAWIMSRSPQIDDAMYEKILARMKALNYNTDKLQMIPQIWE